MAILSEVSRFGIPVIWFCAAYSIGSIPEAWLIARWLTGQDLRRMGSGNVGVMNTAFSVTRWAGLVVFLSEIMKGVLAVIIPRSMNTSENIVYLCVVGVVAGARWPIWLGFKGGRGNSAGLAAFPLLSYPAAAATVSFWVLARLLFNNSFKASRLTFLVLPLIAGMASRSGNLFATMLALSWMYLWAQQADRDDHTLIKQQWTSLRRFLTSPPRRHRQFP